MGRMVEAMCSEIAIRHDYLSEKQLDSVYLGGGTPSLLHNVHLSSLTEEISKHFTLRKGAEVTIEANPDDISIKKVHDWLRAGVNRVSLGIQSFDDSELRWMQRVHGAQEAIDSVKRVQDAGINNISVDLIYGSRFQTLQSWESSLRKVISLGITHLSVYNLTIEKKTRLGVLNARGEEPAIDEELSAAQFELMSEFLRASGFRHYEISNLARPGFEAIHNSSYWKQLPYLGIGPSAHSFNGVSRSWNVRSNSAYMRGIEEGAPPLESEELSERDLFNEYVVTRLRTDWGCDVQEIGASFPTYAHRFISDVNSRKEHFEVTPDAVRLRRSSWLLADGLASSLLAV